MKSPKHTVALATMAALAAAATVATTAPVAAMTAQGAPVAGATTALTFEIRGHVTGAASQAPVGGAKVDIVSGTDAAPVAHAATDVGGDFRVQGLRPGRYAVRIRAIGYVPRALPAVVVGASSPIADVGTIELTAAAVELQAITVTGQKRDVELAPDRNTYVVRDMPTTRGGSALDVLRNVPSVDVDIENVVSLRGNTGVIVQINGRPSPMKPAQLGNFLAQLPAEMVERVEVIPNPSARDDPEGVAGIINIVLRRRVDVASSGGLTLAGGTTGRAEIGGNLGYQRGPLSMYGSYGFLRDNRPRTDAIDRANLYLDPMTYLAESGVRTQVPLAHTATGSAGYKLGEHDELTADLLYSTRAEAETNDIEYRMLDAARNLTALSDRSRRGTNHESEFESTLGYEHAFAAAGHTLASELRVVRSTEGGPSSVAARTLALDGTPTGAPALETQTAWERPDEGALRLDYARPLMGRLRMEAGYKGSLQRFHTTVDTRVLDTVSAAFLQDSTRTSDFTYRQLVNAGYGMLVAPLGSVVLQAGLRVERATTQFHLNTLGTSYDNPYSSVFPSALVAYNIDASHQVKLSYSTRIRRPDDTDQIDPTLHYQDPLNVSQGNPYLQPEYIRAVELGLQRTTDRLTMQVTPFLRHTLDAMRSVRTIDSAGVATRTFANVATTDAVGTDGTIALRGGRLDGFASASAFRQSSNAANLAPGLSARTFGWTARTNATLHASKSLDLQALLAYQAPTTVEQGRNASRTRLSLAARQKLMGDQLNLTLRVVDPFNTSRERFTTIDPRFLQVSDRRRADRGLVFSANWNFGKLPEGRGRDEGDQGGDGPP